MNAKMYEIRVGHEYGTFFVHEHPVVESASDRATYAATWCCYSSFGTFGYHWTSMGKPFAAFIAGIRSDYLLCKISTMITDHSKAVNAVLAAIQALPEGRVKERAQDEIEELQDEFGGMPEALLHGFYNNAAFGAVGIDWEGIDTKIWEPQAERFAEVLWPAFVQAVLKEGAGDTKPLDEIPKA